MFLVVFTILTNSPHLRRCLCSGTEISVKSGLILKPWDKAHWRCFCGLVLTLCVLPTLSECQWILPAGLWSGLVLTAIVLFALICWRKKRSLSRTGKPCVGACDCALDNQRGIAKVMPTLVTMCACKSHNHKTQVASQSFRPRQEHPLLPLLLMLLKPL